MTTTIAGESTKAEDAVGTIVPSAPPPFVHRIASGTPDQEETRWLNSLVTQRPGWGEYVKGIGHPLENPDAVHSWQFAVEFSEAFQKQISLCEVCEQMVSSILPLIASMNFQARYGKTILKKNIVKALLRDSTWMSAAERAIHVLRVYGDGGTHAANEVIQRVSYRSAPGESPLGAVALQDWLADWKIRHPV